MSEMHPNDLTLLRIAIPQDGEGVPEDILLHVCQCSVCMEKVRNVRRMSDIECFLAESSNNVFQERKEDIKTRPIALYGAGPTDVLLQPFGPIDARTIALYIGEEPTEYVPGDAAIPACAAAMPPASAMAADYLDSDNVASALTDLEDDSDILAGSDEDFDFDFGDIVDTIDDFFSDN